LASSPLHSARFRPESSPSLNGSGAKLVTNHHTSGYLAARYGVDDVGAVITSQTTQAQPSAEATAGLLARVRREEALEHVQGSAVASIAVMSSVCDLIPGSTRLVRS
jgi:ABC-type Zn uptake system ZnuABC Zn-binding protein ZnuA